MTYQFTIEQLAERGYSIYYHRAANEWCWCCIFESRGDYGTKEQVVAAASAHCRENYEPPRPDGVPQNAEFRLPKKGDWFKHHDSTQEYLLNSKDCGVNYNDAYNGRRWCWRDDEKPKSGEEPKIDKPTLADLELKAQLVMAQNQLEAVQRAIDILKDQRCVSLDDAFRIIGAVRAIHDAKWWGK